MSNKFLVKLIILIFFTISCNNQEQKRILDTSLHVDTLKKEIKPIHVIHQEERDSIKKALKDKSPFSLIEEEDIIGALIDLYPDSAELYLERFNNCYSDYENSPRLKAKAMKDLSKYLKIKPKNHKVWNKRGHLKGFSKDYKGAISDFKKALSIKENHDSYYGIATGFYFKSNYEKAINYYSLALELDKENLRSLEFRALSYLELRQYGNACRDWEKAWELGAEFPMKKIAKYCQ